MDALGALVDLDCHHAVTLLEPGPDCYYRAPPPVTDRNRHPTEGMVCGPLHNRLLGDWISYLRK